MSAQGGLPERKVASRRLRKTHRMCAALLFSKRTEATRTMIAIGSLSKKTFC